jgi:electron transfer flavoprotein beta subunit
MVIVVPIKQVPESSNVKMDPTTGTIVRAGVESVVNPLDLYALETALHLKDTQGAEVYVITMGPPQAKRVLKEAIAMGCDHGVLISDRAFGGADTWATSYTIAQGIKKVGKYDLIITGERATDGDTAQVGPGIAAWLEIPAVTYVSRLDVAGTKLNMERLIEEGYQKVSASLPCMVSVLKEIARPRLPTLKGKIASMEVEIPTYSTENMTLEPSFLGLQGSPTKVTKIESPKVARSGKTLTVTDDVSLEKALDEVVSFLEKQGAL